MVIWGGVEHFSDLLQEALSVQLSSRHESVFSKEYMLTFESCVEAIRRQNVSVKN